MIMTPSKFESKHQMACFYRYLVHPHAIQLGKFSDSNSYFELVYGPDSYKAYESFLNKNSEKIQKTK